MHSGRWRQKILRRTMHGLAERAVIGRAKSMKFLPDAKLPEIISQMSASASNTACGRPGKLWEPKPPRLGLFGWIKRLLLGDRR
jgi:hypothetical protein